MDYTFISIFKTNKKIIHRTIQDYVKIIFFFLFFLADPKFSSPITNITVPVGREAVLTCVVHDLVTFKVSLWFGEKKYNQIIICWISVPYFIF